MSALDPNKLFKLSVAEINTHLKDKGLATTGQSTHRRTLRHHVTAPLHYHGMCHSSAFEYAAVAPLQCAQVRNS